jgi:hypothetical protein
MYHRPQFVTNSSSTHSMVWVKKPRKLNGADWGDGEFGWQPFILSQPKDKEVYMAVMLYENFRRQMPHTQSSEERVRRQVNSIFGRKVLLINNPAGTFGYYLDHQSLIKLPKVPKLQRPEIHLGFFSDFCHYVVDNPHIMILGGNDNDTDSFSVYPHGSEEDPIWRTISKFDEGTDEVEVYHLDKPRKWRIVGRQEWSTKQRKLSEIVQFPLD